MLPRGLSIDGGSRPVGDAEEGRGSSALRYGPGAVSGSRLRRSTEWKAEEFSDRLPRPRRAKDEGLELDPPDPRAHPPRGGVSGLTLLSHTPARLSTARLTAPGPRGRDDPPETGVPALPAALLPLSIVRSRPRLLQSPVSPGRARSESPRRREAASAEPGRPARPSRSAAGLSDPVPGSRDASLFPIPRLLRHPPPGPAPADTPGRHVRRARRPRCAIRALPTVTRGSRCCAGAVVPGVRLPGMVRPMAEGRPTPAPRPRAPLPSRGGGARAPRRRALRAA